jgi:HD-like signal output (HDOD) protein
LNFQLEVTIGASKFLDAELSQRLTAWVDALPAFAPTVQRIVAMSKEMYCSPRDLVHVIETDPVVMVKVLKVLNSAQYGYGKNITSVNQAVAILGFNTIKNLALGIADTGVLPSKNVGGFDAQRYLLHSLTTAAVARLLAAQRPDANPQDYYIAGLLHDFGKVMIAQYKPSRFRQAMDTSLWEGSALHTNLQSITGMNHEQICAGLLESWGFKETLVTAIRLQYEPEIAASHLVAALHAANLISKAILPNETGLANNDFPDRVQRELGGNFSTLCNALGDLQAIVEETKRNAIV